MNCIFIFVSDFKNNRLLVYDKNFILIRTITTINNQVINAVSLETNNLLMFIILNNTNNTHLKRRLMKHLALIYLNNWEFPHLTMTTLNFFHLILNFMKTFYLFVI